MPAEVITIASLKGGVGKTTSSYALCAAAAAGGLKVIAIDLDPTGGLSNALERAKRNVTVIDVLHGRVEAEGKLPFELPSSMDAVRAQLEDVPGDSAEPLFAYGHGLSL